ncbi:MAG: NADPH:quinone oxidoreductase family protein [Ilumatobacteraceae bacterium]
MTRGIPVGTMTGWHVVERGRAEYRHELPIPGLGDDGEATLVAVDAAAANFADRLLIDGKYQLRPRIPFVPGFELAGTVVATNSARLAVGDRVAGTALPDHGSWAEYAVADARHLTVLPDDLDTVDAVGFHVNAQTAWFALHRAGRVRPGETVLVHAAAGGVGSMAVQLGVAHGCRVVGTASGPKLDLVRRLGADFALDNRDEEWPSVLREMVGDVDVVVDPVGDAVFAPSWKALAFEGRYVTVGFASGSIPTVTANQALVRNVSLHGMYWTPYATRHPELVREAADRIFDLWRSGRLDPCITVRAPLRTALDQVDEIHAGRTTGKTVLTVDRRTP